MFHLECTLLGDSAKTKSMMPGSGTGRLWWFPKCFFFFFCLPAFSRNYMHGDEHSPSCDPACHCRSCRQWNKYSTSLLYGRNLILCKKNVIFFFFLFSPRCTVLHCAVNQQQTWNFTVPHLMRVTVIAQQKASALLIYSVVLNLSMLLLRISFISMCCHTFICWFGFCFILVKD